MRKLFLISAIIGFFSVTAFAGSELVGTTSSNFVKIPPFARAVGMGEAFTAVSEGTYGIYYNPAGLTSVLGYEVQLTHIAWFQSINYEFLSLVTPFPIMDWGKLGIGFAWFQIDEMSRTSGLASYDPSYLATLDYPSLLDDHFSPFDYTLYLAYALDVRENISAGVSIKYTSQNIDNYSGSNITADIGFLYKVIFNSQYLRLGLDISNLGSALKMHDTAFDPPFIFKAGLSDQFSLWNGTFLIAAQAIVQSDYDPLYSIGGEYWIYDVVALRCGYKLGAFNHATLGLGLRYWGMEFDYAFVKYEELGNTHRFSLLYSWGTPPVKLKVYPYVFSPNNDKYIDTTNFFPGIKLPDKIKSLKLNIYDPDGRNLLGSIQQEKFAKSFPWNGAIDNLTLPDGVYQASISVGYDTGTSDSNRVAVEIDNTPPQMKLDADPKLLKPGAKDALIIPATFTFFAQDRNKVAKWQFTIWDYDRKVFYTTGGNGEPPLSYIWDGKGLKDQVVKTGEVYWYSFTTWDSVGNKGYTKPEAVVVLLKEIKLTFSSDALFDLGKADVKISAYSVLKGLKDILTQNAESDIVVAGFTDNTQPHGIKYANNTELSKARAEAVKFFMVNLLGYDENKIKTEGYGELNPIATNDTEEGRLKNRRVELTIKSTIYK